MPLLRGLLRSPGFLIPSVLTIGLGLGANAVVFRKVYDTLFEALPYRAPQRLVHIMETHPEFPRTQIAAPDFDDWKRRSRSFAPMAAFTFQAMNKWTLTGEGEPEIIQITQASHELFPMLGATPLLGRWYTAEEEARKAPVVLISESLWRRKLAANPNIAGRTIRLVDFAVTVAGVVSKQQAMPSWADVWMPITFLDPALTGSRKFHPLEAIGRLRDGVTLQQAEDEMRAIAGSLAAEHPATNRGIGASLMPLQAALTGNARPGLLIAWGAVSLVLLLATVNVAHLVLVRTAGRAREMAVRAALGATQKQLAAFLFFENAAVCALGASLALAVLRLTGQSLPLLFLAAAGLLSALLLGIPALFHLRGMDLYQAIKQSAGLWSSHRKAWFGNAILASEVALALAVIAGAALLYRSYQSLLGEDVGFHADNVAVVDTMMLGRSWEEGLRRFEQDVAPRLRAIPGVVSVAAANFAPMTLSPSDTGRYATRFGIPGRTFDAGRYPVSQLRWVTQDYFATMGIPLQSGRTFDAGDRGKQRYIINATLARRFFGNENPTGKSLLMNVTDPKPNLVPIVGVVGDVRDLGLDIEPQPTLYVYDASPRETILVKTAVDPASLLPVLRRAVRDVEPNAVFPLTAPLRTVVADSLARRKQTLSLLGAFAALALLLTAIGVYGVMSDALTRRANEFAIRIALGATRGGIWRLVLTDIAVTLLLGLGAGSWMSYLSAQAVRSQLYKTAPADPWVLMGSAALIVLLALMASVRPIHRAASISPESILRE
ncbi:MAG: ABC transporter permease [Bryobacterales bacterium]|nr:ABC transporter permease [Bryobacterales bacterium]